MDNKEVQKRLRAAYDLLSEETTTIEKFESVRTLVKDINPKIDGYLAQASQTIADYEKLYKGEIIELSLEKLPEETEEEKRKKKALLLLIRSWKDLRSEVERVQNELHNKADGQKDAQTLQHILSKAKGPFGIITIAAVLLVGGGLIFLNNNTVGKQEVTSLEQSTLTPASQKKTISAIEFKGEQIPLSELEARSGPDCDSRHYHAANQRDATALDGTIILDPGGCAYGKVHETKIIQVEK